MKTKILCLTLMIFSTVANAGYELANNGRKVTCYADDSQVFVLNAARTTIKYAVEGESRGAQRITEIEDDGSVSACYTTSEGTLCLNDGGDGDTFFFDGDSEATYVDCE